MPSPAVIHRRVLQMVAACAEPRIKALAERAPPIGVLVREQPSPELVLEGVDPRTGVLSCASRPPEGKPRAAMLTGLAVSRRDHLARPRREISRTAAPGRFSWAANEAEHGRRRTAPDGAGRRRLTAARHRSYSNRVDIAHAIAWRFPRDVWWRGTAIVSRVRTLTHDDADDVWYARVQGTAAEPYEVWVFFERAPGRVARFELDGECNCPAAKPRQAPRRVVPPPAS